MPVAAASYALTTPADFLAYIGEPSDPAGKAIDRAQRLINAYSKAILKYTRRQFQPIENAVDKVFAYEGNGYLSLQPYEARVIHTVTLHTDRATSEWWVLDNQSATTRAEWLANPRQKSEEGTYWSLTLPELGRFHPYYDEPLGTLDLRTRGYQVTVNADWGVAEADMPEDVVLALWIAVANAWRNPEGYKSRQLGPLSATDYESFIPGEEEGLSLPRASRSLLWGYRRRRAVR